MSRRKIIRISLALVALVIVLFTVLVVHIAIVTNPKGKPHYGVQLARIDFKEPMSPQRISEISAYVRGIKGVGNTMYNESANNLVFAYNTAQVSGSEVYQKVVSEQHVAAHRFLLTPEEIARTAKCPVMKDKGVLKILAQKIQIYFL